MLERDIRDRLRGEAELIEAGGRSFQCHLPPLLRDAADEVDHLHAQIARASSSEIGSPPESGPDPETTITAGGDVSRRGPVLARASNVVSFKSRLYEAQLFTANTDAGPFTASGTLCGNIDFTGPWQGSYPLSPDEAVAVIVMLKQARDDVLGHSDPLHDPRIIER